MGLDETMDNDGGKKKQDQAVCPRVLTKAALSPPASPSPARESSAIPWDGHSCPCLG